MTRAPHKPPAFVRYQSCLWWALALGLAVFNVRTLGKLWLTFDLTTADYSTFFVAGKLVNAGRVHELYNLTAQAAMHLNARFQLVPLPFNHAPYEALLFALLARLPYLWSYASWNLLTLALLIWIAVRLRPRLPQLTGVSAPFILVLGLVFWPNVMVFLQGQDSLLVTALFTGAYLQVKSGREESAGVLLALGLFKFHLVLPLLVLFLFNRQWKLVKGFVLTAAGLLVLSFALVGPSGVADYFQLLSSLGRMPLAEYTKPEQMPNIRGLLNYFLAGSQILYPAIILLSFLALFAVIRLLPGADRGARFDVFFASATFVTYALSFNTYEHDMAIMFPGLLLAGSSLCQLGTLPWKCAAAVLLLILFVPLIYLQLYFERALFLMCIPILLLIVVFSFAPHAKTPVPPSFGSRPHKRKRRRSSLRNAPLQFGSVLPRLNGWPGATSFALSAKGAGLDVTKEKAKILASAIICRCCS
jgi:hypothetical protein